MVDDFEPWRRFIVGILQDQSNIEMIGQVSDGMEAVQQAKRLRPELILLDIGLPTLNGIEAARQIRRLSPSSKILFISDNRSSDIAEEALTTGSGYLVKADAGHELLPAIKAVLEGKRFVSGSLGPLHESTSNEDHEERVSTAPLSLEKAEMAGHHEVVFYADDSQLLDRVTKFIGDALKIGHSGVVIATESHRNSLVPRLLAYGVNFDAAVAQGRYIALDSAETLSTFMANGTPDAIRFRKAFGELILTATRDEHSRIAVFGECVHLLLAQGNAEAAIRMEKLGSQLVNSHYVDILCGYSLGSVEGGMDDHILQRICAEHSGIY